MADAYGTIIVSGNFTADLDALASCLNSYDWSNDNCQFRVAEGAIWFEIRAQYPTVYPEYQVYLDDAGNEVDPSDDDLDLYETDGRKIPLQDLAADIGQHIKEGFLQLTAVAHQKNRTASFETVKFQADGCAERKSSTHSIWNGAVHEEECFVPYPLSLAE